MRFLHGGTTETTDFLSLIMNISNIFIWLSQQYIYIEWGSSKMYIGPAPGLNCQVMALCAATPAQWQGVPPLNTFLWVHIHFS